MTEQKRKRGRPPGSGKKGSKDKPKVTKELTDKIAENNKPENKEIILRKRHPLASDIPDEQLKYPITPMSNWAIENRKKKLGLKD